jgi:hypothetical protein
MQPQAPPLNLNTFNPSQFPFYGGGQGVEILKFVSQFNAPKEINEEFWGPMSKIMALGNFIQDDIEDLRFHLDDIIIESFSKLSRKELSNFDERTFDNLNMVFDGLVSVSQGGFLMTRSSEQRVIQENNNTQSGGFSLKNFLHGNSDNKGAVHP